MSTFSLWLLLLRRRWSGASSGKSVRSGKQGQSSARSGNSQSRSRVTGLYPALLAILAFAVSVAILLTVLGGTHAFIYRASPEHDLAGALGPDAGKWSGPSLTPMEPTARRLLDSMAPGYVFLAGFATLILVVPIAALAGSAARLVTARRDAELSALRLAGATSGQTVLLASLDATSQAGLGALLGILGYFALMPVILLLRFQNQAFTVGQLWVGVPVLLLVFVGVVLLALVSSLLTLSRVMISPLGVSRRTTSDHPGRARVVLLAVGLAVGVVCVAGARQQRDALAMFLAFSLPFVIVYALINLAGPAVVRHSARRGLKSARTADRLLTMRRILDNPKRAWRNVSGVALAVFVAGICAVVSLFSDMAPAGPDMSAARARAVNAVQAITGNDVGLGGLLTLVFAAVLAAVSSGIMQASNVYDQQEEYRELILEGADDKVLSHARLLEVMRPLRAVIVIPLVCVFLLFLPALGVSALAAPRVLLSLVGGVGLCFALMWLGVLGADRAAARLGVRSVRTDD